MSQTPKKSEARGATQWTPPQQRAIETAGVNVLVSAAAGSGKTSVLAERCAYLVCDAPAPYRCEVDELLVVTFTVAAAAEMRTRIAAALARRYEQTSDARLARQLALIDRAQIGTIHGFCSSVIRQQFHLLNVDPNFQMISEEEGTLLRSEIARDLFADQYETDETGVFQRLIDRYGDGNDAALCARVIRAAALLESLVDPQQWLESARQRTADAATKSLSDSELGRHVLRRIGEELELTHQRLIRLIERLQPHDRLRKYQDFATEILACVGSWRILFAANNLDALSIEVKQLDLPRFPTLQKLTPEEQSLKNELTDIRDGLKKGVLFELCRFSEAEWRDGMQRIIEPTGVFLDLVEEFRRRYASEKNALRVLDFGDLERLALRALSEPDRADLIPSAVAIAYQTRFKHVLVDEYQDINELQDAILSLVSRSGEADGTAIANFFCVGDVKQSIYRFRLAEPKRFLDRYHAYRDSAGRAGTIIDLQTNFRSRGRLLQTLNELFKRLMTEAAAEIEYDRSHYLTPPDDSPYNQHAIDDPQIELHLLPQESSAAGDDDSPAEQAEADDLDRTEREAAFIASRIRELMDGNAAGKPMQVLAKGASGESQWRPVRFKDMAILLRSMKFKAEQFADILRASGIPVHADSGTGFFSSMEVRDILALLKVLDNPRQDIPLAAVLRSPIASIAMPEDALARVRLAYSDRNDPVPFHVAVVRYSREHDDELAALLRDCLRQLAAWRELSLRRPLAEVLWTIYDSSGYLAFCEGLDDGQQRVANLIALHQRARQFGSFRKQGLGRFMRFLDSLGDETDLGLPSVASEADDVVRIMSVHRSKGLEFPVVFVPDLGKKHNLKDSQGTILFDRQAGIGLQACDEEKRIRYPSLASTIVSERLRRQMLAEEMRVLYVATTRAREKLILLGTCELDRLDEWRQEWAGHIGALPADVVLGGSCMLDWIGPALAAIQPAADGTSFQITVHSEPIIATPIARRRNELSPRQRALAELQPIQPEPISPPQADEVWRRVTDGYEHDSSTKLRASNSVTAITHIAADRNAAMSANASSADPPDDFNDSDSRRRNVDDEFVTLQSLRLPRTSLATTAPSAADIGTATHIALEHLDYTAPLDADSIDAQIARLVEMRLLDSSAAAQIDRAAIAWFVETELGQLIRAHAAKLLREAPINVPRPPEDFGATASPDPMDRVMLRGRLDALLPLDGETVLIDFKTDHVDARTIESRLEQYRAQLRAYVEAVQAISGSPVKRSFVVFLKARVVCAL